IKAVASLGGKVIASDAKHTVGPPVALRLTPILGPGGLRANGSDVALIDVATEGPGVWRGGYNSGKIHSINNSYLDLECGINRVAIRSTLTAGAITVRARCAELKAASVT